MTATKENPMEYRAHLTIPGLTRDQALELLAWLTDETDLGPVMSGPGPDGQPATIAVSTDEAHDRATAAGVAVVATGMALGETGLAHLYPTRLEIERLTGPGAHAPSPWK